MANRHDINPTEPTQQTDEARGPAFHYYSGGEVKELAGTRASQTLYVFWSIVIAGAMLYFLFGGALGPTPHGGFKPGGSQANYQTIQAQLTSRGATSSIPAVDLTQPARTRMARHQDQAISRRVAKSTRPTASAATGRTRTATASTPPSLNPKPRNLHDGPFMQAMSYQRITTSLHQGVPGTAMPRWENLLTRPRSTT